MWLHRYELLPPISLGVLCFIVAGWSGLVVGFLWSTVLVYHATFGINSLAHVCGSSQRAMRNTCPLEYPSLGPPGGLVCAILITGP